ncbi:MAG TPA: helix-hairpin-helix domain-containing protein [Acidobacteriota bacterium]|nr:helix-hairpin-helix domain-containing protein [Acidobacteriota bacterium]
MDRIGQLFAFSPGQLRLLSLLSVTAFLMGTYLLVESYARQTDRGAQLPVFLGENDRVFTGLFQLDPNTAPVDSLELLPGVGRAIADRIVAYRRQHRFEREIDVTDVRGIGPKTFERLRPYLKVRR